MLVPPLKSLLQFTTSSFSLSPNYLLCFSSNLTCCIRPVPCPTILSLSRKDRRRPPTIRKSTSDNTGGWWCFKRCRQGVFLTEDSKPQEQTWLNHICYMWGGLGRVEKTNEEDCGKDFFFFFCYSFFQLLFTTGHYFCQVALLNFCTLQKDEKKTNKSKWQTTPSSSRPYSFFFFQYPLTSS